jgi:hypothetical protein
LHLGAGQKHEKQQTQPVKEVQEVSLVSNAVKQMLNLRNPPEHGRSQNYSGKNLSDYLWLAKPHKDVAKEMRQSNQEKQNEQD